ncbi:glycosyltransferase family 4 protein [Sphingobium aquiterrae]|uniref:glycosyltransferase family 4 protein n=1 Tax=Sphingobium aquiterrae TaxID=2038656 RepID=UPI003017E47A
MTDSAGVKLNVYSSVSRSGAMRYVSALVDGLAGAGAQVRLIAPHFDPREREPGHPSVTRDILPAGGGGAGAGTIVARGLRTASRIAVTFPKLLRARRHARDYIVTFYDWIPIQVAQFLWIKAIGGRITHIVHDVTPHAWRFPRRFQRLERWLQGLSYRLPDRVVVLTQAAREELAADWGRSARVWVLPHGAYDSGDPVPAPGDRRLLLFGSLRRNKRIREAIEAMRLLRGQVPDMAPGLRLTIAGAPHLEDSAYWEECAAAASGLEDVITMDIGFVPEERLHALLAQSDAVLLPYEEFRSASGVAILSAFAERLLITTSAGGISELIEGGLEPVTIAQPVTAEGIADAVRRFHALPVESCRGMAFRSRARLAALLSWDRIGRACLDIVTA